MNSIYIAGPMRGFQQFNFPAFMAAEQVWKDRGWIAVNPARVDMTVDDFNPETGENLKDMSYYLSRDVRLIADCEAIGLLEGWENSKGACIEVRVGLQMGKKVYDTESGKDITDLCLGEGMTENGPNYANYLIDES